MKITFLGATETVTGSRFLLETVSHKTTLIDCGLFQGQKKLRLRNWEKFPFSPGKIDGVVLTHAHIDHTGYLPLLIKNGFRKKVYCSPPTRDLCSLLLKDCAHLQEEDAYFANKHGFSKHSPALPLYTQEDAQKAMSHFKTIAFGQEYSLYDDLSFQFHRSGHILGASSILFKRNKTSILFSGDIGRNSDPLMRPPVNFPVADYLVMEGTYGNRLHSEEDPLDQLEKIIQETFQRGGTTLIPAFAVGRTQNIIYYLYQLKKNKRIPNIPIFLDSPMAIHATKILQSHDNELQISSEECEEVFSIVEYVSKQTESKRLNNLNHPAIIISASGMATGGRVLHHLKNLAPSPKNTIVFTGFQAGGTRGDRLVRGEKEIKLHGQMIPVRAKVELLTNTSAHADYEEMLQYLKALPKPPSKVFLVHGEKGALESMKQKIEDALGWPCLIPEYLQTEIL